MASEKICTFVLMPLALLAGVHCDREPAPEPKLAAPAGPKAPPTQSPKVELGPIRPVPTAEEAPSPPVVPASLKTFGAAGEQLETDVYSFKTLSFRRCGDGGERLVLGAEVEITAKTSMAISPRDVVLRSGGILFYANLDLKQQHKGCTPLLQRPRLKARQAARGFVLFDVPSPKPPKLELTYQPTRWGGAPAVRVDLGGPR